jgi:hypothetical protein
MIAIFAAQSKEQVGESGHQQGDCPQNVEIKPSVSQ